MSERPSPLQNRVTPFGEIIATPERGMFLGNRGGQIHNAKKELTSRRWVSAQWITCLLEFKGRHMEVMAPHRYTQLFFLDEATAFAAGHRPCFECRRADAKRFFEAWRAGNPGLAGDGIPKVPAVDAVLQHERLTRDRAKLTFESTIGELPDGVLVVRAGAPKEAWLLWQGTLWKWSPGGYMASVAADEDESVRVLTPKSIVQAFSAGYVPVVHPSLTPRPSPTAALFRTLGEGS
jgi:hypothetical protein